MKIKIIIFTIIFLFAMRANTQGKKAYVEFRSGFFNATYKPDDVKFKFYSCGVTYLRRVIRYSKSRLYFSADLHIAREKQYDYFEGNLTSYRSEVWLISFYWGFVNNYGADNYFYDVGFGVSHINEQVIRSGSKYDQKFLFPAINSFQLKAEIGKGIYVDKEKKFLLVLRGGLNLLIFSRGFDRNTFEELESKEWVNIIGPKVSAGIGF